MLKNESSSGVAPGTNVLVRFLVQFDVKQWMGRLNSSGKTRPISRMARALS